MSGKGSNSVKVRHYNERFVLDAIRRLKEASKSDLARAASLTPAAVAAIVDGLESSGFVKQVGKRFGQRGSPSTLYRLTPERIYSVGIKIGRRALEAVLVDFAGEIRARESHEYRFPDPDLVLKAGNMALATFEKLVDGLGDASIVGVGIASPYFLGGWSEELGFPDDLGSRWEAIDLTTCFATPAKTPVFVENDATSAALAELVQGAGARFRDFMHISIDTFVGGGLVQGGRVHTGPHGNSAALGPLPVSPSSLDSVAAKPARYQSLLHRASIYVLVNHLRSRGVVINRVRELDPLPAEARVPLFEWIDDCASALVEAIIAITSIIDIEAIVLDSILPRPIHLELLARVQAQFNQASAIGIVAPEIVSGQFGPEASSIGAAMLPFSALLAPDSGVLMIGKDRTKLLSALSTLGGAKGNGSNPPTDLSA
ncbi:ROK family transcriptional regulator [Mesorhizobium sp. LNJC403B00]|uniref:ROK family transcriptional regulator n=1 Tax=Mesorhizobium sp. LSHC412B00 TaxID=1287285 RepID=UPI0003CE4531|nr:ROK family transcriptional regulator [Mesorhizobium sp. LSHC412B00]ESX90733.1 ROK family transcriptional regulator [Mesorhizobium sp. LSHC412B00]ESX93852.1 ROK family transcriptional regulator [Mesorhizobium sp. LNJC403B00]